LGFLELRSERFLGKHLRVDVDIGETSPVFVRESPFGDEEACTTSESSIAGANLTAEAITDHEREAELEVVSTPLDKIQQAILDISLFARNVTNCGTVAEKFS
jgi:hypothetical protein